VTLGNDVIPENAVISRLTFSVDDDFAFCAHHLDKRMH